MCLVGSLKYKIHAPIHTEDFHTYIVFYTVGKIDDGNGRFHALIYMYM